MLNKALNRLNSQLKFFGASGKIVNENLEISSANKLLVFHLLGEHTLILKSGLRLPLDLLISAPDKIAANVISRLGLNKRVHGRTCHVKKISKTEAQEFLNSYHVMNGTDSAYNYGLYKEKELLTVASFSKGRKMNRLPEGKRSYELIRSCTKAGITVTGGLSKILKHFISEKNPGDIMTYVDRQFSEGVSFLKLGFKEHSITAAHTFLINRKTGERKLFREGENFNKELFYKYKDEGNLKLVFTVPQ